MTGSQTLPADFAYVDTLRRSAGGVQPVIYDGKGQAIIRSFPNLDPNFFHYSMKSGNITTQEIEEKPYRFHPWIHACAWAIARNICRLPLVLVETDKPMKVVPDKYGILRLLRRPNPFQTGTNFWQDVILKMLLPSQNYGRRTRRQSAGGQTFVIPKKATNRGSEKVNLLLREFPDVLLPMDNDNFNPITRTEDSGMQSFLGWKFSLRQGGSGIEYLPYELIRLNFTNPYDMLSGISSYEPAQIAVLQDIRADIYNTRLFENNAMPTGVLSSDEWLEADQRKEMLKSWYEEMGAPGNMQKTAIMGKGLNYKHIGLSNVDMQYDKLAGEAFNKIIASFGLNKIALGRYEQINFSTIKEGRKLLWHDNYIPTGEIILEQFNNQWVWYIDENISLKFDHTKLDVLREDYTKRAEAASTMCEKMGFPPLLACDIVGIPLREEDIIKYPWLADKPPMKHNDKPEEAPKPKKAELSPPARRPSPIIKVGDEGDLAFWNDYVARVLDPAEKEFQQVTARFFLSQRNRMQDKVDTWLEAQKTYRLNIGKVKASVIKQVEINPDLFLLDIKEETKALKKAWSPVIAKELNYTAEQLEAELGELIGWNLTDEKIDQYITARAEDMRIVNVSTMDKAHKEILGAIETGTAENLTVPEIARDIKKAISTVGEIRKNQSKMIARTETGFISNTARFDAFKEEGFDYHRWVTAGDEKVRTPHAKTNNKVVKIGVPFQPINLLHPNDPNGRREQIINCRCVAVAAEEPKN